MDDQFQIFQPVTTGDSHHDLMGQWAPQIPRIFTWSLADVHHQLNVVWEVMSWFGLCKTELMFGGIIPSSANVGSLQSVNNLGNQPFGVKGNVKNPLLNLEMDQPNPLRIVGGLYIYKITHLGTSEPFPLVNVLAEVIYKPLFLEEDISDDAQNTLIWRISRTI